jgi:predicted MFS family arabinose efflux permease
MARDFRLYWCGQAGSMFGTVFTATALGLLAVRFLGASATQTGVLVAADYLPPLVFGLLAGVLADRVTRPRRVLIGTDLLAAGTVATLALGWWLGWVTIWWLVALTMLTGCGTLLVETLYFTHLRGIVPEGELVRARARLQAGEYGAGVLGRALAGPVIAVAGAAAAFLVDAVSYLVSAAALAGLNAPDRHAGGSDRAGGLRALLGEVTTGLRVIAGHRFLLRVVVFTAVQALAFGGVSALTAQYLVRVLDVPTPVYGLLFVLVGVCGLAGSLVAGRLATRNVTANTMVAAGFVGSAASGALLPVAGGPLAVASVLAALGIGLPVFFGAVGNVGITAVLTGGVPEETLGRTVSSIHVLVTGAQLIGALAGGVLGDLSGIHPALWMLTGASMAGLVLAVPMVRAGRAETRVEVSA